MTHRQSDEILSATITGDVACLVVGDPFGATTHADLMLRAKECGIATKVVHNASKRSLKSFRTQNSKTARICRAADAHALAIFAVPAELSQRFVNDDHG